MVETAAAVEWIEVRNEVEALFLEHNLIQRHHPRFNIDLKDDKSYPYLAVTLDEEWPRAMVMRGAKRRGVRYFGPYAHAWAIRETLDALLRTFPIRTCTANKFQRHARLGKPCLYAHIEQCVAPCVDAVTREDYDALVASLVRFLDGDTDEVVERLTAGGDFDRVQLMTSDDSRYDHQKRYNDLDIVLDTFPFTGASASFDALWMGVPVITLSGWGFVQRMTESLHVPLGLKDLVARTTDEYEELAISVARDPARLLALRQDLRQRIEGSILCDGPAYARSLEAAYRAIWERWCETGPSR